MASVADLNKQQAGTYYSQGKIFDEVNLANVDTNKINNVYTYKLKQAESSNPISVIGSKLKYLVSKAKYNNQNSRAMSSARIARRGGFEVGSTYSLRAGEVSCFKLMNTRKERATVITAGYKYTFKVIEYSALFSDLVRGSIYDDSKGFIGTYWIYTNLLRTKAETPPTPTVAANPTTTNNAEDKRGQTKKGTTVQTATGSGIVTASTLNVRSGPGTSYKVVGTLKNKASVSILEVKGEWGKIKFASKEGQYGWVCLKYIKYTSKPAGKKSTLTVPKAELIAAVFADPIKHTAYTVGMIPDDNVYISSPAQYNQELDIFDIPEGYTRSKMIVHANENNEWKSRNFEFIIGPNNLNVSFTNNIQPVKTGGGYIILRNGEAPTQVAFTGYFLNTSKADERRVFLENYYKKYLVDKVNAFYEYFNDSHAILEVEGYRYYIIPMAFTLTRPSNSLFLYGYTMSGLCTKVEPIGTVSTPNGDMKSDINGQPQSDKYETTPFNLVRGILI